MKFVCFKSFSLKELSKSTKCHVLNQVANHMRPITSLNCNRHSQGKWNDQQWIKTEFSTDYFTDKCFVNLGFDRWRKVNWWKTRWDVHKVDMGDVVRQGGGLKVSSRSFLKRNIKPLFNLIAFRKRKLHYIRKIVNILIKLASKALISWINQLFTWG